MKSFQASFFSSSEARAATEERNTYLKFSSSRPKLLIKMQVKELLFCRILQSPSVNYLFATFGSTSNVILAFSVSRVTPLSNFYCFLLLSPLFPLYTSTFFILIISIASKVTHENLFSVHHTSMVFALSLICLLGCSWIYSSLLRQLENSEMESKCCGHPMLCSLSTMYTFLLGTIFIALSSSRILLVKYSANEGKLRLAICMEHLHLITHSSVFCFLVGKMGIIPFQVRGFMWMMKNV